MIPKNISLAYTPSNEIFNTIMKEVEISLNRKFNPANNQSELFNDLYSRRKAKSTKPFIWIIWDEDAKDLPYIWRYTIRRSAINENDSHSSGSYFSSGFLGIQVTINTAIINYAKTVSNEPYEIQIQEMPQTNLMYVSKVRQTSCIILLLFTCALLPIALETQALTIRETKQKLKKYLLVYNLSYIETYIGWILYGIMSAFPVCLLGTLSILFIFRWTTLIVTFLFIFMYFITMLLGTCLVSCFNKKESVSTFYNICIILVMSIIAIIMFNATYNQKVKHVMGLAHLLMPPLTFLHGLDRFAFGYVEFGVISHEIFSKLEWFIFSWIFLSAVYFLVIVYLQNTSHEVKHKFESWHVIFEQKNKNAKIMSELQKRWNHVEPADESQGLALSFRQVTKVTSDAFLLRNISFDIYRGEYTVLNSYETEYKSLNAIINLIIGTFQPESGSINILGMDVSEGNNILTQELGYVGYCPLPQTLIPELTVEEHMIFLLELCMVIKTSAFKWNYITWRIDHILQENPTLTEKRNHLICDLSLEECAQLCWIMATITDPRIIILDFAKESLPESFKTVIYCKIKENIGKRTIIQTSICLSHSEYTNRCFMFDQGNLVCAGAPAFLVSRYGRSYTLSVRLNNLSTEDDVQNLVQQNVPGSQLQSKIARLLIFQIPLFPTKPIASICKLLDENLEKLHIDFYDLLLPPMDEIYRRAALQLQKVIQPDVNRKRDLKIPLYTSTHKDQTNLHKICINIKVMWKKYKRLLEYYKISWCLFFTAAILFAIYISVLISNNLKSVSVMSFESEHATEGILLTVEATKRPTKLVIRSDTSKEAIKVFYAYTFSEPDLSKDDVSALRYVKLHANESMEMYLMLQAISEPFHFVKKFAYGLDISYNDKLSLKVYYSSLHIDYAAVSRSVGRAFMALLRFETNTAYATIQVTDEPVSLDLSQNDPPASSESYILPLLLTIIVSFVTILPSLEKGTVRRIQVNTANFSPLSYWSILLLFDFTVYCAIVTLMMLVMKFVMYVMIPLHEVELVGLFVLVVTYGFAAIPQAYLFSYFAAGLISAINYVFTNIIFYETVLVLLKYGYINLLYSFIVASPLFNLMVASRKINKIILNNNQCGHLKKYSKCKSGFFHACCLNTCGVFQKCFIPQHSLRFTFDESSGIIRELLFMVLAGVFYIIILLLIEYEVLNRVIDYLFANIVYPEYKVFHDEDDSVHRETQNVENTWTDLKSGVTLAVKNVFKKEKNGFQSVGGVSFNLKAGEIMGIVGHKNHGLSRLLQLLARHGCFSKGDAIIMQQKIIPIKSRKYAKYIGYSAIELSCPPWLTVYESLEMIGLLRGIDIEYIYEEVNKWLCILDLTKVSKLHTCKLIQTQVIRLNLAIAMIAEPQILILENPTYMQTNAMTIDIYTILEKLQTKGRSIIIGTDRMERIIPICQKIAIISRSRFKFSDQFTNMTLVRNIDYTVIFHFKHENLNRYQTELKTILSKYFHDVEINDLQKHLANVWISDRRISWGQLFGNLEKIKESLKSIENYIVQHTKWQSIYLKIIGTDYKSPDVLINAYWRKMTKKNKLLKCESDIITVPLPSNLPICAYFGDLKV